MFIPFGEWLPDLPAHMNPGATVAKNCVPRTASAGSGTSYGPLQSLTPYSGALAQRCQGAFAGRSKTGQVTNLAGDATRLYKLTDTTWTDVSKAGGYSIATDETWRFCQFGERVLATDLAEPIQSWTLDSSSQFADLAATAPKARHIASIDPGFVMVGNTSDPTDGGVPNRVWWSALEDPATWPTPGTAAAAAVQSDRQDLPTGGWVQAVIGAVGGARGAVLMDSAIYRVEYEGPPTVFGFYEVERARGTPAPGSVINVGPFAFYLGEDGFYAFDGSRSIPIGANKVDKTFYSELDQQYFHRISVAVDPVNKLVFWAYPAAGHAGGNPNRLLVYNWEAGRWAMAEQDLELVARLLSRSYSLDGLDAVSASLDALPFSLDSRVWTGGRILLGAFDSTHRLGYFDGAAMAATIETGEFGGSPAVGDAGGAARRLFVSGIRPIVDGGSVTARLRHRGAPDGVLTDSPATSPGADGACPQRIAARYVRAQVAVAASGSWSHARGIEAAAGPEGLR